MNPKTVKLGDVCELVTKGTTPTSLGYAYVTEGIPFLRVQNIQGGAIDISDALFIDEKTDAALSRSRIRPNDILISIAGTIGRCGVVPADAIPMNCNQAVAIVRLRNEEQLNRQFLIHWLATDEGKRRMTGAQVTGTISNLSLTQVSNLEIPLPPLAEQQRIAAILDRADALRGQRRASLERLDELAQSLFLEQFGDPATNPKDWEMVKLGDVALTTSGGTPNRTKSEYFGGGIPWVKSGELNQTPVVTTEETLTEVGVANSSAKIQPVGTVLLALYGATVGKASILAIKATTNQAVCCIQVSDHLNATFLLTFLRYQQPEIVKMGVGGAQPNISQQIVKSLSIPLPPLSLQREFARQIGELESIKVRARAALVELDALFAALQERAFVGDLAPDRGDLVPDGAI